MKNRWAQAWARTKTQLAARMPTPESIQQNRWLSWLGPAVHRKHLWHFSRRGLALGMAIGVFFGFLIPIAQIPFSAAAAVALRANLPVAMVSTLVTNPVTFAPVYYAAYQTGHWLLGTGSSEAEAPPAVVPPNPPKAGSGAAARWERFWSFVTGVGKPLVLGLVLFAVCGGVLVYAVVSWVWIVLARRRHRARKVQRAQPRAQAGKPPSAAG